MKMKFLKTEGAKILNRSIDNAYVASYRTARDKSDHRHTTGNMGQLESKTLAELTRLK